MKTDTTSAKDLSVSIIIPCHNEEMNIAMCYSRIPHMGSSQEIIFIDDGSTDKTKDRIAELMTKDNRIRLISYSNCRGKGHAVRSGFSVATGDVLIILDADMSVMPEDLPKFFSVLSEGRADFVNGTRMIYPVKQSMHFLHILGNRICACLFTCMLRQRITDTLCGTKAFLKRDYGKISRSFKDDRWGDIDLLIGAARAGLRVAEIPIRYQRRLFGCSKMRPFRDGLVLFFRALWGFKNLRVGTIECLTKNER